VVQQYKTPKNLMVTLTQNNSVSSAYSEAAVISFTVSKPLIDFEYGLSLFYDENYSIFKN
jgi:hypothetical protein